MNRCSNTFFYTLVLFLLLTGCSNSSSPVNYSNTIAEGRAAAREIMDATGATSISLALTDGVHVIWGESFGFADKATGQATGPDTMFCIGSTSKMLATVAAMILVDQGKISLDEPLVTYLPGFTMSSPEYRDITVRMLLNHSSGFPGTDYRNSETAAPYTGYAAQVMEGLKSQRLKHTPGYLNVYCNDGFTMVENLVKAVTGLSYPAFVQQQLLVPLGMTHSRYATEVLPAGTYARPHTGNTPNSYDSINAYASGGFYSTPADMSRLASMLMNGGTYGSRRILSERSVDAMGQDQTLGSFNPLPTDDFRYGLGWDSVNQPGLNAAGIKAWTKGGDVGGYGAVVVVAPDERLAITVMGVSNGIGSTAVTKIAERILLRALVERGRLSAMPGPAAGTPLSAIALPAGEKEVYSGYYALSGAVFRVTFETDDSLTLAYYTKGDWQTWKQGYRLRSDGWYAGDADPIDAIRLLSRAGRSYFALRQVSGAGHYSSTGLYGQRLDAKPAISQVWQDRLNETWLPVNDDTAANLALSANAALPGYLFAGSNILCGMTPQSDNLLNGMILLIPQANGRDLADLAVETREGLGWLRLVSTLYRPLSSVAPVAAGQSAITIGTEGFAEWHILPVTGSVSISGATAWKLLGADLALVAAGSGSGSGNVQLTGFGPKYLALYGAAGSIISLNVTTP